MTNSDDSYMKRGKAQVLFNYLPGNTFDYTGKSGIHRVEGIDAVERSDLDIGYIGRQVLNKVQAWRSGEYSAVGFPQYADSFQLVEPREVTTSVFPLLFRCTTCERIHSYKNTNELAKYNRSLNCKSNGCSGSIQQHQFVFIHECGEIKSPFPGQCSRCNSYDDWKFESFGSQRFRNARWFCLNCKNEKDIEAWCNCDLPNSRMQLTVHRASSAFQPHHLTVINIGHGAAADASAPRFGKTVFAKYLGLTDEPFDRIELDSRRVSEERERVESQLETYQDMYESQEGDLAKQIADEIEDLEEQLDDMDNGDEPIGDEVAGLVPFLNTDGDISQGGQQAIVDIFQYHNLTEELKRRTAREIILEAGADTPQSRQRRELRADRLENQFHQLGLENVAFVEDFPITNVVFGFTRINREPDDSRLIAFSESDVDSSGDGTPLFTDTVETEAIQVELSPRRVVTWVLENSRGDGEHVAALGDAIVNSHLPRGRKYPVPDSWDGSAVATWCTEHGIDAVDTEPLSEWDEPAIRSWLAANMDEIPTFDQLKMNPDDGVDALTYFVYHLLHTYSHLVLKHATQLSGFSRSSLAEFLMPRALSFVLYSNQRTDFNIGALYTLVESTFSDLLTELENRGNDCVYDPVCSREGGACHNCLHLSEVSCVHFNRNVGRDFVYGSKGVSERHVDGYLGLNIDE